MAWERDQKNLRRIGPWVAIKTHWSGGSLCFGKSINHGLPEARRVQLGKDHAVPPPWVSSFRISSWLHQQTGYWLTRLLAVMLLRSQLRSSCLGHVSTYSPWIKKKKKKPKRGKKQIQPSTLLVGSLVVVLFSLEWTLCCKWQEAMNHKNKIILTLVLSKENKDGSAISSIIYVSTK